MSSLGWKRVGRWCFEMKKMIKKLKSFFKKFDWEKVLLNVFLTAIIPIILFTIPVTSPTSEWSNWGSSIVEKLQQGILFSTIISIASNIVLSYRTRFRGLFSKTSQDNIEHGIQLLPFYSNLSIIISSFVLMLLSAFYYGQIRSNSLLNCFGLVIEVVLFILIQLLYGYSEGSMREDDGTNIAELVQKAEEQRNAFEELVQKTEEQRNASEKKDFRDLKIDNKDFDLLRERRGGE